MALGIAFDGMQPMADMLDLARRAEGRGVHSLWMAEHMGYRDAVAGSMALLAATRSCTVAPSAISIYARHPMIVAMTAATLEEFGPGRTVVVLATGNPRALGELGLDVAQPLVRMREYVEVLRALYDASLSYLDHHVGRLLEFLRRQPGYADTWVVVTADHGELLGEHGRLGHHCQLDDQLLRVPLIVRYPRGQASRPGT